MVRIKIQDMDLAQIAASGQCFRIRRLMEGRPANMENWSVQTANSYVEVVRQGEEFCFSCEEEEFVSVWRPYFDLDTDYGGIKKLADPQDAYLCEAVNDGWGVRILRQDLWEMIITFLISQNNNITRITRSVQALCGRYGETRTGTGFRWGEDGLAYTQRAYDTFPEASVLAAGGLEGLAGLGLGYRDKYILSAASRCAGADGAAWLDTLRAADYAAGHRMLKEEPGIGRKVADCICLFGLHHVGAFPVDTHVKQIIQEHYPDGFPLGRYEGCAGVMQQYLFYHKLAEKSKASNSP